MVPSSVYAYIGMQCANYKQVCLLHPLTPSFAPLPSLLFPSLPHLSPPLTSLFLFLSYPTYINPLCQATKVSIIMYAIGCFVLAAVEAFIAVNMDLNQYGILQVSPLFSSSFFTLSPSAPPLSPPSTLPSFFCFFFFSFFFFLFF